MTIRYKIWLPGEHERFWTLNHEKKQVVKHDCSHNFSLRDPIYVALSNKNRRSQIIWKQLWRTWGKKKNAYVAQYSLMCSFHNLLKVNSLKKKKKKKQLYFWRHTFRRVENNESFSQWMLNSQNIYTTVYFNIQWKPLNAITDYYYQLINVIAFQHPIWDRP